MANVVAQDTCNFGVTAGYKGSLRLLSSLYLGHNEICAFFVRIAGGLRRMLVGKAMSNPVSLELYLIGVQDQVCSPNC